MVKILNVVGARPNFMKMAPIIAAMNRRSNEISQRLAHTGQHYDESMSDVFFDELGMPEPDEFFHQEFVRALFDKTVRDLRAEYEDKERPVPFTLFERFDLAPAEGVSYAQLAQEFHLTQAQVTNHLAQVRRRFRERALDTLRGLCGTDQEFRREARDLFGLEIE